MHKKEILRIVKLCLAQRKEAEEVHDASDLQVSTLCSLWAGMGHIYRVGLPSGGGGSSEPIIIKHIASPKKRQQSFGDQRKARSYQVEANFYEYYAKKLRDGGLQIPKPYVVERDAGKSGQEIIIAMSYMVGNSTGSDDRAVLRWLATLHGLTWGKQVENFDLLQETGSYWHLDTRPDEHASMPSTGWEGRLKLAARAIDERLKRDEMQCIIHGDAKDANVLYNSERSAVAMCDFQYCGKGCPTKDLAYFFCSSSGDGDDTELLEFYLGCLQSPLSSSAQSAPSLSELKTSMDLAYCDYYRFMSGWGFWGSGGGEERVKRVLDRLDGGTVLANEEEYEEAMIREFG